MVELAAVRLLVATLAGWLTGQQQELICDDVVAVVCGHRSRRRIGSGQLRRDDEQRRELVN